MKKRINLLDLKYNIHYQNNEYDLKEFIEISYQQKLPKSTRVSEENDYGNIEYKLKLIDSSHERIQHLTTQMKFRIKEGDGEAFY